MKKSQKNKPWHYATALLKTSSYRFAIESAIDALISTCTPRVNREMVGCDVPERLAISD